MPKKYRKKPVEVEALQVKPDMSVSEVVNFIGVENYGRSVDNELVIRTLEGDMKYGDGDYIIKGVKGEFYLCKPDIFEATYEESIGRMSKEELKAYKYKKSLIHTLMIIYGYTHEEARKVVHCEKLSDFIFNNLKSKVSAHLKEPMTIVNHFTTTEGVDVEKIVDKIQQSFETAKKSY